jgi:hypothetical protein
MDKQQPSKLKSKRPGVHIDGLGFDTVDDVIHALSSHRHSQKNEDIFKTLRECEDTDTVKTITGLVINACLELKERLSVVYKNFEELEEENPVGRRQNPGKKLWQLFPGFIAANMVNADWKDRNSIRATKSRWTTSKRIAFLDKYTSPIGGTALLSINSARLMGTLSRYCCIVHCIRLVNFFIFHRIKNPAYFQLSKELVPVSSDWRDALQDRKSFYIGKPPEPPRLTYDEMDSINAKPGP